MLKEIQNTRQRDDEPARRWFNDETMDLIVWVDDCKAISGYHLTYDKSRAEHALTWDKDQGFLHHKVDDGEGRYAKYKSTPILVADGPVNWVRIAELFRANSEDMDKSVAEFVYSTIIAVNCSDDSRSSP